MQRSYLLQGGISDRISNVTLSVAVEVSKLNEPIAPLKEAGRSSVGTLTFILIMSEMTDKVFPSKAKERVIKKWAVERRIPPRFYSYTNSSFELIFCSPNVVAVNPNGHEKTVVLVML